MIIWAMFCWETLSPAINVNVTMTHTTYLSIVADHVHPFMETVFPDGCGLFQQDNKPCHKAKMVQEWFEEHSNKFEVLASKFPRSQSNRASVGSVGQTRLIHGGNLQDLKNLLITPSFQTPQSTVRGLVDFYPSIHLSINPCSHVAIYPSMLNLKCCQIGKLAFFFQNKVLHLCMLKACVHVAT